MTETLKRIQPQNIDAEKALLGCVLLDEDIRHDVFSILESHDFYREDHREIFESMQVLDFESKPIDILSVEEMLKARGTIDRIGGLEYIIGLSNFPPVTQNAKYYAEVIREKAVLRRLIKASSGILNKCYEEKESAIDIAEMAETEIMAATNGNSLTISHIEEAVVEASEYVESRLMNPGKLSGIKTGFIDLDYKLGGLQDSDLVIIAGRPSMGKTAFAENIATKVAIKDSMPVAFFSLEMPRRKIVLRQVSSIAMIDNQKIRLGNLENKEVDIIAQTFQRIVNSKMYVDDTPHAKISEIASKCRRIKKRAGDLRLVVIDHLTEMWRPCAGNDVKEHEANIRSTKRLARELGCPVILLQQLNRGVETRRDHRPMLSDLKETGSSEEVADIVLLLYREDYYKPNTDKKNIAEVNIAKGRDTGTGTIELRWHPEYTKFGNLAK